MIVSRYEASRLAKGAADELHLPYLLEKGTVVEVHAGIRLPPTCRIQVIDWWEHTEGGYVHRVRVVWLPAVPRLLHRKSQYGYTDSPALALTDAGECIPKPWQDEFSKRATEDDNLRRAKSVQERLQASLNALDESLAGLRALAAEEGADVRSDVRVIERRRDAVAQKLVEARKRAA